MNHSPGKHQTAKHRNDNSSCSTSGTRRVNLVTNTVISHKWGKDREVLTTSGTYPWSFMTQIVNNGQPSHGGDRKTFEVMTSRVSLVEQELLNLPKHLSSPPVFSGVRVTRYLVFYVCFVDRCLSFCTFSLSQRWPLNTGLTVYITDEFTLK
jgi:hypothetical protein